MDVSELIEALNPAQRDAVCAEPGNYLVLAGAGSGKTRVLTHRIAWLNRVFDVPLYRVLAVTFTNKAAAEMRSRLSALLPDGARGMWVGTFHGIAHRLLRLHWQDAKLPESFQVLDADDQLRLVKRVVADLQLDETRFVPKQLTWWINAHKDAGRRPGAIQVAMGDQYTRVQVQVYEEYESRCQRSGLVDFAEILLRAHETLLNTPVLLEHYRQRFGQILVDEFQDTNNVQFAFIRLLAGERGQVFVVGDDDQSIYGWRGAQVSNMQKFLNDYPDTRTIRLEQNYRSTGNILAAANAVIAHNPERLGKKLWTEDRDGELIDLYTAFNEVDEARHVIGRIQGLIQNGHSASECAVLYRNNAQSRAIEEQLLSNALPYRVYGGQRFFERMEIRDAMAYLRLVSNRDDDTAFERAVNTPPRGIGDRTLDELRRLARDSALSLWQAAELIQRQDSLNARARNALAGFLELIVKIDGNRDGLELYELFDLILEQSGLRLHYGKVAKGELDSRVDNLDEWVSVASRFSRRIVPDEEEASGELAAFLAYAALEAGEGQVEEGAEGVQLMTLHSAKGLEFPFVFLVGMEEGLFPSTRSLDEANRLEEERRLAYVGITRARRKLTLTYAESRRLHGMEIYGTPSRFIREIPEKLIHAIRPKVARYAGGSSYGAGQSLAEDTGVFRLGQSVRHATFGEGVIVQFEGSGAHARVQVNFRDAGSKWLVLAYAKLQAG
jgi:DNA helicase II / ATP-dependent DNA helicase PcrA